jgi:hypothetical protein
MTQRQASGDHLQHPLVPEVDQQDPLGVRMGSPTARQQLRARHRAHRLIADEQRDLLARIAQRAQPLQRCRGGGLTLHPKIGVETPVQVSGQHLDRGRVLVDDEEDRP